MPQPRFSSQHGEDRWIIENLKPAPGYFLDIGAFNGVTCSNTLAFEDLGWHGICVEPDPIMAAQCTLARKCEILCAAVGKSLTNPTAFFINPQDRGLSSLHWKKRNATPEEKHILVPVLGLDEVILCCPEGCDLLSIDTEGTELEVWSTRKGYSPRIVIIEYQTADEPSQEVPIINQLVHLDGYTLMHRTPHNLVFAR